MGKTKTSEDLLYAKFSDAFSFYKIIFKSCHPAAHHDPAAAFQSRFP